MIDISEHGGSFGGGGGSNIKSVQRGSLFMGATSKTVNVNSVDITSSVLIVEQLSTTESFSEAASKIFVMGEITNNTTLTFSMGAIGGTTIQWTLIEFKNLKSFQKGTKIPTSSDKTITVNSVDTNKSLLFFSRKTTSGVGSYINATETVLALNSPTIISITLNANINNTTTINWYLVEFN